MSLGGLGLEYISMRCFRSKLVLVYIIHSLIPPLILFSGTDAKTRDFVGWAWYDRTFFFQATDQRVVLRFGSVHYNAMVRGDIFP